jgi:hypothetical protein
MGEGLKNDDSQREQLREIIGQLNEDSDIKKVQKKFDKFIKNISPDEIANIEQSLIDEGVPVEHVQKLCDVHVKVFDAALKKQPKTKAVSGHPIHSFKVENREAVNKIRKLKSELKKYTAGRQNEFKAALADMKMIETHYVRKENQLFPYLETVNFTGPSKVMWGKHDEIRDRFHKIDMSLGQGDLSGLAAVTKEQIKALKNMIFMEEKILFPTAMRKLPESVWVEIRRGESAIGYSWIEPGNLWDANIVGSRTEEPVNSAAGSFGDKIPLDTGALTPIQINLLLKNLPFDMTFVDENGKVAYYSEGKERIFPRSPGIIGRDVANCHPPKSVHIVENIVEQLKSGEKDEAEFWLQMNGMFIHIRYFPLRDEKDVFRGIIEVSQEVTAVRALEGERRLLDW